MVSSLAKTMVPLLALLAISMTTPALAQAPCPAICDPNNPPNGYFCSLDPNIGCGLYCVDQSICATESAPIMKTKSTPPVNFVSKSTTPPQIYTAPSTSSKPIPHISLTPANLKPQSITVISADKRSYTAIDLNRLCPRQIKANDIFVIKTAAAAGFEWLVHANQTPYVLKVPHALRLRNLTTEADSRSLHPSDFIPPLPDKLRPPSIEHGRLSPSAKAPASDFSAGHTHPIRPDHILRRALIRAPAQFVKKTRTEPGAVEYSYRAVAAGRRGALAFYYRQAARGPRRRGFHTSGGGRRCPAAAGGSASLLAPPARREAPARPGAQPGGGGGLPA